MSKKKRCNSSDPDGFRLRLDPNLDEALRRAVTDVLSKMTTLEPGAPITYSIDIRVDENGIPSAQRHAGEEPAPKGPKAAEVQNPLIEVVEREKSITVIAEVMGVEAKALRVLATPKALEVCRLGGGKTVDRISVINLPKETNPATATARYRNGVLEVVVEKGKGPAARTVMVE